MALSSPRISLRAMLEESSTYQDAPTLPLFLRKKSKTMRPSHYIILTFLGFGFFMTTVFNMSSKHESNATQASSLAKLGKYRPYNAQPVPVNKFKQILDSLTPLWTQTDDDALREFLSGIIVNVKTGVTIAAERIPVFVHERRNDIPEMIFYADGEVQIGDVHVNNAYRKASEDIRTQKEFSLYFKLETYLRNNIIPRGHHGYWLLARYVDTQLQGLTYEQRPNKNWYLTLDDDTFVFWRTFYRWLSHFDPNDELYLGHYENFMGYEMANGGCGYVISKNLMQKTYGADPDFANKNPELYPKIIAGDARLGKQLSSHPNVTMTRPNAGDPIFNTETQEWITYSPMTWHRPVLTLGHMDARRRTMARQAEHRITAINKRDDDVRFCDVYSQSVPLELPFLQWDNLQKLSKEEIKPSQRWEIKENWRSHPRFEFWADVKSADECRQKCEELETCVSFAYFPKKDREQCKRSRLQDYTFGVEEEGITSGWDMQKISQSIGKMPCSNTTARAEMWEESFQLGRIDLVT